MITLVGALFLGQFVKSADIRNMFPLAEAKVVEAGNAYSVVGRTGKRLAFSTNSILVNAKHVAKIGKH